MPDEKNKLLILIPAYNEEESIVEVIKGIPSIIEGIDEVQVLVVDDGSKDKTAERVRSGTKALIISHSRNLGLGVAFRTGIEEALKRKVDFMVSIDADGQFNTEDIPRVLRPVLRGRADFVTGSRFKKGYNLQNVPKIKLIGNRLMAQFISFICSRKFSDVSCGFRAYSKEALLNMNLFGKFTYTQEVILNLSFKDLNIKEVPIGVKYFPERKSFITGSLIRYVFNALKIIFRTIIDYIPLRFFGILGALIFCTGLLFDFVMVCIFLKTGQFSPHKFIGISGLILNIFGLAVFILGLLTDILNRVRRTQERILYYQKKKLYHGS